MCGKRGAVLFGRGCVEENELGGMNDELWVKIVSE